MPRKTPTAELLSEKTAPISSPLRRSTRLSSANANSPAPATIPTRRSSHNDATSTPAKTIKARRTSTALENVVEDIASESKPTPRGKRAVALIEDVNDITADNTAIEENGVKLEKSGTLEKNSVSPEVNNVSGVKKALVRGRRRSTSSNESEIEVKPKPVRNRRNSSTDNKDDPPEKPVKARRSSINDKSPSLEPEKRITRARRSSITKESEEAPASSTPLKRTRRGRRTSTDSQDTDNAEPQDRKLKGRRLSVTENVFTLDPINEVETEKDTKAFTHVSPHRDLSEQPETNKSDEREVNISANQAPIQRKTDTMDLNLSVINESFSDENRPKMSPKLNKDSSDVNNLSSAKSPLKLHGNNLSHNETNDCSKSSQMEDVIEVNGKKVAIMSYGSDDSFKIQLNSSLTNTTKENEDVLETSKSSDTSDKENISSASNVVENQVNISKTEDIQQSEKSVETTTNTTVARVSNVFRPKMIELSFSEPMEIDECSANINKSVFDVSTVKLHESVISVSDNTINQSGSTTVKIEENTLNITHNTFIESDRLNQSVTFLPTHRSNNDNENSEEIKQVKSEVLENLDTLEPENNEPVRIESLDAKCDSKTTSPEKDANHKNVSPNITLRRSGRLSKGLENKEDVSPTITSRSPKSTKNSVSPSVSKEMTVAEQKEMITESENSSPDRLSNLRKIQPTSKTLNASLGTRNLEKSMDYDFNIPTDEDDDEDDAFIEEPSNEKFEHTGECSIPKDTKDSPNKRRSSSPDVKENKKQRCSPQKSKQLNVSNDKSSMDLSKSLEDKFMSETTDDGNQNMEITKQIDSNCSTSIPVDRDHNSDSSTSCNISFKKPKELSPGKIPEEVLFNCDTTTDSDISFRPRNSRDTNEQFEMQETFHCSISETSENTSLKSKTQELSNVSKSRFSLTENNSKVDDCELDNQSGHKSSSDSFKSNSSNKENLQSDKSADQTELDMTLNSEYSPKTICKTKKHEDVKNDITDTPADKESPQEEACPVKHKKNLINDDLLNISNDIVECHNTQEVDSRTQTSELKVKSPVKGSNNDSDYDKSKGFDGTSDNELHKSNHSSSMENSGETDKKGTKLKLRETKDKSTSSNSDTTDSLKVKKSRSKNKRSSYCGDMQEKSAETLENEIPSKSHKEHSAESYSDTDDETDHVDTDSRLQYNSLIHSSNSNECLDGKAKKKKKSKKKRDRKPDKDVLNLSNDLDDLDLSCDDKVNKRLSLEEFANSKMDAYLSKKIKELEEDSDSTDCSGEDTTNEFIDDMAEEGEEDTPSEGSNDIVDHGESVGSSESEIEEEEEDYEEDSFICDDEVIDLLSGDEYDLEQETKKEEQTKEGKQRKRIIAPSDSSDDECENQNSVAKEKQTIILDDEKCHSDLSEATDLPTNNSLDGTSEAINPVKRCSSSLGIHESISVNDIKGEEKEDSNLENVKCRETELLTSHSSDTAFEVTKSVKRRSSSLNIHESIPVKDIKDKGKDVGEMISHIVDSFVSNIKCGEISLNVSIEAVDDEESVPCLDSERKNLEVLQTNMNNSSDSSSDNSINKRLSASLDQLDIHNKIKPDKPHDSSLTTEKFNGSVKKKTKKHKKRGISMKKIEKPSSSSFDDLRTETFNLMSHLITDVKNRPKRINKPSTSMESSWIAEEIKSVKPSTTTVPAKEKQKMIIHARDFKNQMLYDPSRIRRIDTKSLLKKKSA